MEPKVKWYNDLQMVGTLVFFFPPVGIYGIYKSETIETVWKRITFGVLVAVGILLALVKLV